MVSKAVLVILLAVLIAIPASAQEPTATPDVPVADPAPPPIVVVERTFLDELLPYAVIAAIMAVGWLTVRQQGTAAGVAYYQDALKRADSTQSTVDDALIRLAVLLQGYTFTKNDDGSYTVTPPTSEP